VKEAGVSAHQDTIPDRGIIYARVSDPGQSSVPEQEAWGRKLAEDNGWTVVGVIHDEGISGDQHDRPGLVDLERRSSVIAAAAHQSLASSSNRRTASPAPTRSTPSSCSPSSAGAGCATS
jgi:hypothetical protein